MSSVLGTSLRNPAPTSGAIAKGRIPATTVATRKRTLPSVQSLQNPSIRASVTDLQTNSTAAAPLFLNLVLIMCFLIIKNDTDLVYYLSYAVTFAGIIQFIFLIIFTKKYFHPSFNFNFQIDNKIVSINRKNGSKIIEIEGELASNTSYSSDIISEVESKMFPEIQKKYPNNIKVFFSDELDSEYGKKKVMSFLKSTS